MRLESKGKISQRGSEILLGSGTRRGTVQKKKTGYRIHTSWRILCCPGKFIDQISHVTIQKHTQRHTKWSGKPQGKGYSWLDTKRTHYPLPPNHKCQLKMSFKLSLCPVYCSLSFGQLSRPVSAFCFPRFRPSSSSTSGAKTFWLFTVSSLTAGSN